MPSLITKHIDRLRHGKPVGGKHVRGSTDAPLSNEGERLWSRIKMIREVY